MKIAILQTPTCPFNLYIHGGMERVELYELDLLKKNGYKTNLYVSNLVGEKEGIYEIKDLGWRNRFLKFYYYFNFGWRNRKSDIFHGHFTPILALLYPQKSVIHFHGLAVSELILYRYLKKRYHRANYIFCARWVMDDFRKIYPDIPESQIHVVYNGVDVQSIKPPVDKKLNDVINICFYAGWIPEKGIYDVLKAAEILEKKGRDDFRIYYGGSAHSHYKGSKWGDADDIDGKVKKWVSRLKTVELVGNLKYDDLPAFLQKMDIGLVPSSYPEPFGIVNIEIMACGLPVIATKVGGIPEIVVDGETGLLIAPNDPLSLAASIEKLLDSPDLRQKMGKAGRKRVEEKFSWEKHIEQLIEIYQEIIEAKRK